ncbi:hypothetical protein PR202_gb29436 [Eleusine coracana subsp. coracana]|uniref:Phosphoglycolate phosphatase n=1 Tax=Eleusine coracana subsp. coracana TaxID=191504 RepID=A0AAV5FZE2_ELECO|nr:hypothetical protein PR202_gb29436 [Eleusine coracana subsp. coracana]
MMAETLDYGLPGPACCLLTAVTARSLVDGVDAFLFDCDGVIWKGDKLIEGVPETMELLRKMGKKLVFVTNNSRKSRRQYSKKFRALELEVAEVYVVGEDGILEELKLAGFECFGGPTLSFMMINHSDALGRYARACISENPGCLFIATNRDPTGHMTSAQEWPGAGTMVAAVSCSVQKEPVVVGKPSSFLMDFLLKSFNLETSRMCMVGDRLDTDILFGQNTGCKTLLVLSGCTTLSELQNASNMIWPDHYTNNVYDLVGLLQ